jgi:hypothetical protein
MEPYKKKVPFPEPPITCLSYFSIKEPSLQVPLIESLYRDRCFMYRTFLDMSYVAFSVPSTGALPLCSLHRTPMDRGAPFTERPFTLLKSPKKKLLSWFLSGTTVERNSRLQSRFYISFRVPISGQQHPPAPRFLAEHPLTDAPFPAATFVSVSKSPAKQDPSRLPNASPLERCVRFASFLLHKSRSAQ